MSWFGKPDALETSKGTPAQEAAWTTALGVLSGLTGPIRQQDQFPLTDALQKPGGLAPADAQALVSWLGGYANKTGFWGTISDAFQVGDPDVYMDVENLVDGTNGTPVNIGDALRSLQTANATAHAWVIARAQAKRDKKQVDSDADLQQNRTQVIKDEINIVTGGVKVVQEVAVAAADGVQTVAAAAADGAKTLASGASLALKSPFITIGIVLVVVVALGAVYLMVQSRMTRLLGV